jgi:hypothetical protein
LWGILGIARALFLSELLSSSCVVLLTILITVVLGFFKE